MTQQIKVPKSILIGLSFGGMVAVEVAKFIEPEKIILIASAKTGKEIPFYYKLAGLLKLHKLLPAKLLKCSTFFSNWFFSVTNVKEKKLLASILNSTDSIFLKWAIDKILHWKNETKHNNLIHIHGTSDRILPYRFVKADITIINGGHFMTVNKATELTKIIRSLL